MADSETYSMKSSTTTISDWLATVLIFVPEMASWISAAMSVMEEHFTLIVALEGLAETTNEAYGRGDLELLTRVGECLERILAGSDSCDESAESEFPGEASQHDGVIPMSCEEAVSLSFFPTLEPEVLLALAPLLGKRASDALERSVG